MKILFVAMSQSIHTARWINQIADQDWEIHLFPSWELSIHPELRDLTVHGLKVRPTRISPSVKVEPGTFMGKNILFRKIAKSRILMKILTSKSLRRAGLGRLLDWLGGLSILSALLPEYWNEQERCNELIKVIQRIQPDIVHSLELQHAGYLTLEARKKIGPGFPAWIVTNWGADIHYFGSIPEHASKIREVLSLCDYYGCECERDVRLGREFGFRGEILPVLPNTGGYDFETLSRLREPGPTSLRRLVLLKGYEGWVYRAGIGLRAVELCADVFKEKSYRLGIYLASPAIVDAARRLQKDTGIKIELIPYSSHEDMLRLHGQARVSIGLSMSDAISTSFLEAIIMGSFPIQSCTSCADEWVVSGETAYLVPPEDPEVVGEALRRALSDDHLVDSAAAANESMLRKRLDYRNIKDKIISIYTRIYSGEPVV